VTRVNDQANEDQKELDPNARLEKRASRAFVIHRYGTPSSHQTIDGQLSFE
jgi:hypothetical protein